MQSNYIKKWENNWKSSRKQQRKNKDDTVAPELEKQTDAVEPDTQDCSIEASEQLKLSRENIENEEARPEGSQLKTREQPPLPFPQRFQKQKKDKQFHKFLEVFKKLHINIPFAEALEQMPSYVSLWRTSSRRKDD